MHNSNLQPIVAINLHCIINNKANTEHRKTKVLQQMINTANTAHTNLKQNITTNRRPSVYAKMELGCSEQSVNYAAAAASKQPRNQLICKTTDVCCRPRTANFLAARLLTQSREICHWM